MSESAEKGDRRRRRSAKNNDARIKRPVPPKQPRRPIALMVLGMHRSGTSAFTRVLSLLGADLPTALMAATQWNETGHWESVDLMRIHDSILASAGSTWDDWRKFNPDWRLSPAAAPLQDRLLEVLRNDFRESPLFIVKDPRICRFVPLWLDLLRQLPADPVAVIPVRNPLDVCKSLRARDGFLPARSILLWLRHVLDAEVATRGIRRAIVTYESLMNDWSRTVAAISKNGRFAWPRRSDEVAVEIERFIAPKLRHHNTSFAELIENPEVVEWARTTYAAMLQLARGHDSPVALRRLDEVRTAFDQASAAFGIALVETEIKAREQQKTIEHRDQKVAELGQALGAAQTGMRQTQDELAGAMAERERVALAYDDLWKKFITTHEALKERDEKIIGLERDVGAARSSLRETQTEVQRLSGEVDTAKAEAASAKVEAAAAIRERVALAYDEISKKFTASHEALGSDRQLSEISVRAAEVNRQIAAHLRRSIASQAGLLAQVRSSGGRGPYLKELFSRLFASSPIGSEVWDWERSAIVGSGLFDAPWYSERYHDVARSGIDPLSHYLSYGGAERRDPNSLFDSEWYASQAGDLPDSKLTPLGHYVLVGFAQGLDPHPLFDTDWYLANNPEVPVQETNPLQHFIATGGAKGLDPHPLFDSSFYFEQYPDVMHTAQNPLRHYITHGCRERRSPHPLFDPEWYLQQCSASDNASENPLVHFVKHGLERKLSPHPLFDTSWYFAQEPTAAGLGQNPLVSYLAHWEQYRQLTSVIDHALGGSANGPNVLQGTGTLGSPSTDML